MDVTLDLWTDVASLTLFDPAEFESSEPAPATFSADRAAQEGRYAPVRLQEDQTFRARITDGPLTTREQEILNDTLGPLGLVVRSGQVYVSGMDLPGEPADDYAKHGAGGFVSLPPGAYDLFVHEMDLTLLEADEERLPDYVITLQPRREPFPGVSTEPWFMGGRYMERFLEELESGQQS